MNAKKLGVVLMIVTVLAVGSARAAWKGVGTPLPKPVPPTCDSDMLCL